MGREWQTFEEAVAEEGQETLEPLVIKGEEFVFPKTPPALPYFKLLEHETKHGEPMPIGLAAVELLPDVLECLEPEKRESLLRKLPATRLTSLVAEVLVKWGWFQVGKPDEGSAPNPEAPPASTDNSTRGSGRSKQTSSTTTASV